MRKVDSLTDALADVVASLVQFLINILIVWLFWDAFLTTIFKGAPTLGFAGGGQQLWW